MVCVIATRPGRATRRWKNNVQKYAQVLRSNKFRFVEDVNDATVFDSTGDAIQALGRRARRLRNDPTRDLTLAQVENVPPTRYQPTGRRVVRILNGGD